MKLARTLLYGLLASAPLSAAATLPLDRPTPPPCCVDGICRAHSGGFGYFPTRWRTWPGLGVAPMPTLQPPAIKNVPGLPTIVTPTPEEEDRQAPEPTKAATPPAVDFAPPSATVPRTVPLDSPATRDSGGNPATPRTQGPTGFPQPTTQPLGPRPTTTPGPGPGSSGSGLDLDPPPSATLRGPAFPAAQPAAATTSFALPTAVATNPRPSVVPASATAAPSPQPRRRPGNDPPPPPPLAFRSSAL